MKAINLIFITLFFSKLIFGQAPFYTKIDKSKGLPSNSVYDIYQDKKGFIWFATNEGLCRYDGFEFKTYHSNQLTSKSGTAIREDKFGRIWYENFDGYIYYIEKDSLFALSQNAPLGYFDFAVINNNLFVMQKNGIDVYNLSSLKLIKTILTDVKKLSYTKQLGNLFLLSLEKKILYDENGNILRAIKEPYMQGKASTFSNLATYHNGKLFYVGTKSENKICYSEGSLGMVPKFSITTTFMFQNFCSTNDYLWMCTPSGVYCVDSLGLNGSNGLIWFDKKNINCVFKSADNSYWFGTANEGVFLVKDLSTKMHSISNSTPTKLTNVNDELIIGTKDDKIVRLDTINHVAKILDSNSDNHPILFLKYFARNNSLYYTSKLFQQYNLSTKVKTENVIAIKDMEELDENYIAIASSGLVGLYYIKHNNEPSKWDSLFKANPIEKEYKLDQFARILNGVRAKAIAKGKAGSKFYCATNIGLFEISPKGYTEIKDKKNSVYFSKLEVFGTLIIGLSTNGLIYKIEEGKPLVKLEGFSDISSIYICDSFLFVNKGSSISCYTENEGILLKQTFSKQLASEQINDVILLNKKMFIATDNGLLEMNMVSKSVIEVPIGFVINSILVNGKVKERNELLNLSYVENDLDINYSILDFKKENHQNLQYRVNQDDWKDLPDNSRTLHLASLSGGNYQLEFKLNGKILSSSRIQFAISTPWWKQIWFVVTCFVLVCIIIVIYYRWQTKVLKKKNLLLIQKIELEKNLNQSILTSIKAQMNPHFFYNALNTIQSYIFTDDKKNATNYLSKFSKLTRIILEMSEKESVSLIEEIDALTLYLDLEKVRFNQDFDFKIKVGNNLNVEMIKIPSMIIQPFIENSIKHGLLHKKGEKILVVEFLMNENKLEVIIDDNGIGRKKAGELNRIKEVKHNSFSTSANTKRLEILNEGKRNKVGLEIIDKYDSNNQPEGTKVIIQIPL
ncbi:MAG: histidine kinase [Bacteroidetes bacterium]|nr:histidine kinase [Bacteroidota bacterium]